MKTWRELSLEAIAMLARREPVHRKAIPIIERKGPNEVSGILHAALVMAGQRYLEDGYAQSVERTREHRATFKAACLAYVACEDAVLAEEPGLYNA